MPELPEVESVRRQLAPELTGRRVVDVWWDPHPHARLSGLEQLAGRRLVAVERRGKFLRCPLEPAASDGELELVLHLGMTGSLRFVPTDPADPDGGLTHVRVRLELDDGRTLCFRDPRRFGRASVVVAGRYAEVVPTLATLGPEPLSDGFTVEGFQAALARSRAPVKALLLGQRIVAGVGNIYADEALWQARIHPAARGVGPRRAAALHAAIRDVLAAAIDREGTTFRDYQMVNGASGRNAAYLHAYGQAGRPCARCGTTMVASVVAARGTTHCPRCQRR
jgi:formamidopyrimidine-DNA glycosylase